MTSSDVRDKLVEALVLDLIGPIQDASRSDERLDQSPSRWYLTGFLVPRARPSMDVPKDEEDDEDNLFGPDDDPIDEPTADTLPIDDSDKAAVVVTSKRQVLPSSMGLSLLVPRTCKAWRSPSAGAIISPSTPGADGETGSEPTRSPWMLAPADQNRRNSVRSLPGRGNNTSRPSPSPSTGVSTALSRRPSPTPTA